MGSAGSVSPAGNRPISEIDTDSGMAFPSDGVVNVVGGSNVNTVEITNNVIISLDANIVITEATIGTVNIVGNTISTTGTDQNLVLDPDGSGAVEISYLNQESIIVMDNVSDITDVGVMTDGQLAIGSTGATPVANTITAGTGITVTNAPGSITISSTGPGGGGSFFPWVKIVYRGTGQQSFTMDRNTGYITDSNQKPFGNTSTRFPQFPIFLTFPDAAGLTVGDVIAVANVGSAQTCILVPENVTFLPFHASADTGFQFLAFPGGISAEEQSAVWIQYLGVRFVEGNQLTQPTWMTIRVQGDWNRQGILPDSNFRLT